MAIRHVRHHLRFYGALLVGVAAWGIAGRLELPARYVIAGDTFFAVYLLLAYAAIRKATPEWLQRRADYEDEGIVVIVLITAGAVALSLFSIFTMLTRADHPGQQIALAIVSVVLAWMTLHTVFAFHYAQCFYVNVTTDGVKHDARGLDFPQTESPTAWDFLYFSMVIGMTAQVSDVAATSTAMRKLITAHAIASFFFNAGILALAVNATIGGRA